MSKKLRVLLIINIVSVFILFLFAQYGLGGGVSSFDSKIWVCIFTLPILSVFQIAIVKIRFTRLNKIDDFLGGCDMDVKVNYASGIMEKLCKKLESEIKVIDCNATHLIILKPSFIAISQKINVTLSQIEDGACLINIQSYNRSLFGKYYPTIDFGSNYKNCLKIKQLLTHFWN